MNNKNLKIIFGILIAILIFVFLFLNFQRQNGETAGKLDNFASCLASAGAAMYGADWCSHCQNEKRAFGSSFQFVPYVECPANPQKCLAMGIEAFPTWVFPDGRKLVGEQGLEKLAKESGCEL